MNVSPIIGEIGRYYCESESSPGVRHVCDIIENQCGCGDYVCRRGAHEASTGKPYRCKHINAAREYALNDYIEVMREHVLSK